MRFFRFWPNLLLISGFWNNRNICSGQHSFAAYNSVVFPFMDWSKKLLFSLQLRLKLGEKSA